MMASCYSPENAEHDLAIAGVGNLIYGDDGIGVVVARAVFERLRPFAGVELVEDAAGVRLAERLLGYARAVVIDALADPESAPGTVKRVELTSAPEAAAVSLHTSGFRYMLALERAIGASAPAEVRIYGIVIREPEGFSENLSPELEARIGEISAEIGAELGGSVRLRRRSGPDDAQCAASPPSVSGS